MNSADKQLKLVELNSKLKKYEEKLHHLLTEEDKAAGSRYGNEFIQNQIKVYEEMIRITMSEIIKLRIAK